MPCARWDRERVNPERLDAVARAALLRKYRVLARWRRAKDRAFETSPHEAQTDPADEPDRPGGVEDALADRASMRALAAEFPGALRELDRLGSVELERRVMVLSRADAGHDDEPWMGWIVAYHELMRQVLADKRAGTGGRAPDGRASIGVLRALEARFGLPAEEIGAALFPPRRRVPSDAA
jgi:hypothetical protein